MIEQQGRVTRAGQGQAWVLVGPTSGCAACAAGEGCGAGVFGRLLRRKPVELPVTDSEGLRAGQAVMVGVAETVFVGMVMRMYGWPLLWGLALAGFCHHIAGLYELGRAWTDLASLSGLLAGAWAALAWRRGSSPRRTPGGGIAVLRVIEGQPCAMRPACGDPGAT